MNENKVNQAVEEKKPVRKGFFKSKARLFTMIMAVMTVLSISAFADDGSGGSTGFEAVTGTFGTISTLLGQVFTLMTSNALLALFLGISLIGAVIGLFVGLKRAARH